MSDSIGKRIRKLRLEHELTLEDISKKVGVTKATINKYESNIVKNIKRDTIEKLAEALSTSPEYLMGWTNSSTCIKSAHNNNNNAVIETNSGTLINNNSKRALSKEELELLRIYNTLNVKARIELLTTAIRLEEAQ